MPVFISGKSCAVARMEGFAMIEQIEKDRCIGCGSCAQRCPLDVIRMDENRKAYIAYPEDCMTCYICERFCPAGAIYVHPFREALPKIFTQEY